MIWPLDALNSASTVQVSSPSPTPAWQPELAAAHLVEGKLLMMPPGAPEDVEKQRAALGEGYRRLAAKYPGAAAVQKSAGDYSSFLGQSSEAMRYWQRAEQLDPQDGTTAETLGEGFLRLGQAVEAYQHFQRAVNAAPDTALYHFNVADVLYLFRRELIDPPALPDELSVLNLALEHFRRAAELAPGDLRFAQAYAETFYIFAKPDWQQALAAWQKVLLLSGEKTDFPYSHLARVNLRLRRPTDAETYLARMHDPAFVSLKQKLAQQAAQMRTGSPPRP